MGGRPIGGRPAGGRAGDARPDVAREPQPVVGRRVMPRTVVADRGVPLVARTGMLTEHGMRRGRQDRSGPIRRFVGRFGWRAYAIPLLTVATVVLLVDLARSVPVSTAADSRSPATTTQSAPTSDVPPPVAEPEPTPTAEGDAEPAEEPEVLGPQPYVEQGAGTLSVVDGTSSVYGTGPLQRFIVEVEDGIGIDATAFAQAVETTLGDPRSWGSGGRMSFQRVGAAEAVAGQFEFRVSLVSPGNMETYCPGVGTGGYTSCRYGDRAVINLARWATAVPHYEGDIATYRPYVVNHEVGHVLGNGHVDCPGAGQIAPVMLQQTLGLDGCTRNAWPYP